MPGEETDLVRVSELERPAAGPNLREIHRRAAALVHELWGRGPERCETHWAGPDVLILLLYGGLTPAELTLEAGGDTTEVARSRENLRRAVEPQLSAIVEQMTGRRVRAAMGTSHVHPPVVLEGFLFDSDHTELAARVAQATERAHRLHEQAASDRSAASGAGGEAAQAVRQAEKLRLETRDARAQDDPK